MWIVHFFIQIFWFEIYAALAVSISQLLLNDSTNKNLNFLLHSFKSQIELCKTHYLLILSHLIALFIVNEQVRHRISTQLELTCRKPVLIKRVLCNWLNVYMFHYENELFSLLVVIYSISISISINYIPEFEYMFFWLYFIILLH